MVGRSAAPLSLSSVAGEQALHPAEREDAFRDEVDALHTRGRRQVRFHHLHVERNLPARFAGEDVGRRSPADDFPSRKLRDELAQVGVVLLVEGRPRTDEQVSRLAHVDDAAARVVLERVAVVLLGLDDHLPRQLLGRYRRIPGDALPDECLCAFLPAEGHVAVAHARLADAVAEEDYPVFLLHGELREPHGRLPHVVALDRYPLLLHLHELAAPEEVVGRVFVLRYPGVAETVYVAETEGRVAYLAHFVARQRLDDGGRGRGDVLVHHRKVEQHRRCHSGEYARLDAASQSVGEYADDAPLLLELVRHERVPAYDVVSLVLLETIDLYEISVYPHCRLFSSFCFRRRLCPACRMLP